MRLITFLTLQLITAPVLLAQEASAPSSPGAFSLAEAIEIAGENSPAYRIAAADLAVAETLDRGVWASLLPRIDLSFSTGLSQSRRYSGLDEFERPIRREEPIVFTSSRSSQNLLLGSVTLFDGGRTFAQARADRARARAIRSTVTLAATDMRVAVARQYYRVAVAEEEIELNRRILESARETVDGTERLLRIGIRDPVDLLGAELQVAEREQEFQRSRGNARQARLELGRTLGLAREIDAPLADDLPHVFDPATIDVEELINKARTENPQLANLDAVAAGARAELSLARGRRWPTASLGFSTGRNVGLTGSDALFDLDPLDQSYGVSFSLNLPLFSQFETSDAIGRAAAQLTVAEERIRAGDLEVEMEIRAAMIDLENAHRDHDLALRAAELGLERLELARQKYELGGTSFEELRTALEDAFQRERAVLTARAAFAQGLLSLEEAAGVPIP